MRKLRLPLPTSESLPEPRGSSRRRRGCCRARRPRRRRLAVEARVDGAGARDVVDAVGAVLAREDVGAALAVHDVETVAADQQVVAGAAGERVVARAAEKQDRHRGQPRVDDVVTVVGVDPTLPSCPISSPEHTAALGEPSSRQPGPRLPIAAPVSTTRKLLMPVFAMLNRLASPAKPTS
jgi:hypothetical protein